MTKRLTLSILSLLLVILVATGLCAQPADPTGPRPCSAQGPLPPVPMPPPPPHCSPGPHAHGMPGTHHPIWADLASISLDVKQRHALDGIRNSMAKSVIRKTADLQIAQIELGEALAGDTTDMAVVTEKVRTVASLRADMELAMIRAIEEAKALLTPAQRTTLKELQKAGDMAGCPPVPPPAKPGKKDGPPGRAQKGQ